MAKRVYYSPAILPVEPSGDPGIIIGPSQATIGYDSRWSFEVDEDSQNYIDEFCDDFDLAEMDTDENLTITQQEFDAWFGS